jgi:hypothetical protein
VEVRGGTLPEKARLLVTAKPAGSEAGPGSRFAQVDSRMQFTLDGLPDGVYEVSLHVSGPPGSEATEQPKSVTKEVSVVNGQTTEVAIVVDLSREKGGPSN